MDKNTFYLQLSWNYSKVKDGITVGTNVPFPYLRPLRKEMSRYKDLEVYEKDNLQTIRQSMGFYRPCYFLHHTTHLKCCGMPVHVLQ